MNPIASDSLGHGEPQSRPPMTGRRRFLAMTLGLGLEAPLVGSIPPGQTGRSYARGVHHPFSPARTVVLPRTPGRPHIPARRVIERRVEELAAMDLRRLAGLKIDALLRVAVTVTCYYGLADQLEAWAGRTCETSVQNITHSEPRAQNPVLEGR